ncbi:Protein of unknown function [Burkholderia sp. OK233]|nr:Protein of unknown function [Burkholderia sp. OK233]
MSKIKVQIACSAIAALLFAAHGARCAEVPAGTVIEKANIDKVKADTFDGHTIGSMLTDKVEWQIRNWGLKITLDHAKPFPTEPRFVDLTKQYSSQVKYDEKTRSVSGYVGGLPFPNISESDPAAADKIMWNFYYAPQEGDTIYNRFFYVLTNADKGIESKQDWVYQRYYFKGRLTDEKPVSGDGSLLAETYLLAQSPDDIKGIGVYIIRKDTNEFEETYGYLKSARRTRRLSGGAWMDPIGGTDELSDDINVHNARPDWYKSFKLIGKRWVLAMSNARPDKDAHDAAKSGTPDEFPLTDFKNAPYWNPIDKWQPREVYVIEATPPADHPYSKKVMYVDVNVFHPYYAEIYDKKGEFWKFSNERLRPKVSESGMHVISTPYVEVIDFKARHATIVPIYQQRTDPKGVGPDHWSLEQMALMAK